MKVNAQNSVNLQAGPVGMPQAADAESKNLQAQIANAQKQLQELSSDKEMDPEEKMKKRQELQKQVNDLNNQLRQHQIELRKKEQEPKRSSQDSVFDSLAPDHRQTRQNGGISQAGMQSMISADAAMSQAKVQGSAAAKLENRAGVLETEIKLDASRGGTTEAKQEELAETTRRAESAFAAQLGTLAEADRTMRESAKQENGSETVQKAEEEQEEEKAQRNPDGTLKETAKRPEAAEVRSYTGDGKPAAEEAEPTVSVLV